MSIAKLGQMQIKYTLLDAEGLISTVAVNKESVQYEFMTSVVSFVIKLDSKNLN